ncbi:GSCOCG00012431001-RA-CDS [Cotesia congregata]|nr:GSCOCG00012431001-RA-CDS [Cotesia congregata]
MGNIINFIINQKYSLPSFFFAFFIVIILIFCIIIYKFCVLGYKVEYPHPEGFGTPDQSGKGAAFGVSLHESFWPTSPRSFGGRDLLSPLWHRACLGALGVRCRHCS